MIHVIKELHLNDFKEVHCVRPRDLFSRYGKRESPISFDSNLESSVPMYMSKIDSIEYLEKYDEMARSAEIERQNDNSHTTNDNSGNE